MAVGDEGFCKGEVFGFGMVGHVYHDGVVEAGVGGCVDRFGGLGVVEVEGYGDGGVAGGGGGGLGEEGGGVGLGPGEEEDHGGGVFGGRGADGGEDAFEVVLWVGRGGLVSWRSTGVFWRQSGRLRLRTRCRMIARTIGGSPREKLTTQTPAMAYLPSTAFRSMILALFWERSNLGFAGAGSAMMVLEGRRKAQLQDSGWRW